MKRGEIYTIDLGPGVGREATGPHPVVVASIDVPNVTPMFVTVVPAVDVSAATAVLGVLVPATESGLSTDVAVLARQPRTLDVSRFPQRAIGFIPPAGMGRINLALQIHLGLDT